MYCCNSDNRYFLGCCHSVTVTETCLTIPDHANEQP